MTREPLKRARVGRWAVAAGLAAGLTASGLTATAAQAAPTPAPAGKSAPAKSKLGGDDPALLAAAKARGDKTVTMLVATRPGATGAAVAALKGAGAVIGKVDTTIGYVRISVPTGRADAAIRAAQGASSIQAINLNRTLDAPNASPAATDGAGSARQRLADSADLPRAGAPYFATDPGAEAAGARSRADLARRDRAAQAANAKGRTAKPKPGAYPAPSKSTPADNPYLPVNEIGATDFVKKHPTYDGRGVTVGILDTGVDIDNPALQTTTTGQRKITDWVTATDPVVDGDGSWVPVQTKVSGPSFTYRDVTYQAPAGSYEIGLFKESYTAATETGGDMNRDGDTTDSWAVLYDRATGEVRVDLNANHDFTDDAAMLAYKKKQQIGHFGTVGKDADGVATDIPFTVEPRNDVDLSPLGGDYTGKKADFVSIGFAEGAHATHVAGITAGNKLFGGKMTGAAPGATIVSARACWGEGCTYVALTEGLIDLVENRGVDVVNISIGGLPALNDGSDARGVLYNRLVDTYGVELAVSAGNDGPSMNTVSEPGDYDTVLSVAASVSKDSWAANYGSDVRAKNALFPFSARGPREDGGFHPYITAPGSAVSTVPTWQPGQPVAEAGYALPAGYGMFNGTSMAAPEVTGGTALLLSAAKATGTADDPARLRTAIRSTADRIDGAQVYEQGNGVMDVGGAWQLLSRGKGAKVARDSGWTVSAPVATELAGLLQTPGKGTGIYDRGRPDQGGPAAHRAKSYPVTVTRTTGSDRPVRYALSFAGNDGTFGAPRSVVLPKGRAVTFTVTGRPVSGGEHSAVLRFDDPSTGGWDHQMLATVVAAERTTAPDYRVTESGRVDRNQSKDWYVDVPAGAKSLEVALSGYGTGRTTTWITDPYGVPRVEYNFGNPKTISIPDPLPGVWNIGATASRASVLLSNPYTVTTTVYGVDFAPDPQHVAAAKAGQPVGVTWALKNGFSGVDGTFTGVVGSRDAQRPTIADGEQQEYTVTIPAGTPDATFRIGNTADVKTDLDLYVYNSAGVLVGSSTTSSADEEVVLDAPAADTYTAVVDAYSVPSGSTAFDYVDEFHNPSLGVLAPTGSSAAGLKLANGAAGQATAAFTPKSAPPAGRTLFGELRYTTPAGTVAGAGTVVVDSVTP